MQEAEGRTLLMAVVDRVVACLEQADEIPALPLVGRIAEVQERFSLAEFELDLLLFCAAAELESQVGERCAQVNGDANKSYPTYGAALACLPNPEWAALTSDRPLRRWQLIEIGPGNSLMQAPLRIDEQILHYLVGANASCDRLRAVLHPLRLRPVLVDSHNALVQHIEQFWCESAEKRSGLLPIVQLWGSDTVSQRAMAAAVCEQLDLRGGMIAPDWITTDPVQLEQLQVLLEREFILNDLVLVIPWDEHSHDEEKRKSMIGQWLDRLNLPIILLSRNPIAQRHRSMISLEVTVPTMAEQRSLWSESITIETAAIQTLIDNFNLDAATIREVASQVPGAIEKPAALLWNLCRQQARPKLDALALRMQSGITRDDLVLSTNEAQVLASIVAHVQQRTQVYETWGMGHRNTRGLGISALFAGPSGTGKTTAAEAIANELQLDLYRIDLSTVVSKYIGETEKNLGRIFDAADRGGSILLFDEADALFAKRSQVTDSKDRYANMEVSYLLQRMETYRGLSVLTTNLKGSIDTAFFRRIRFVVQFQFPDLQQRSEIWAKVFPATVPTADLDVMKLAKLNLAGGNIRNIALNAAFIAANDGEPVQMKHLLRSAQAEYVKLERPLTDTEIRGWV
jgi:AAA+ superfamily predicted ATPase